MPLPNPPGQYKGTNGPGKPRPLPQRNRMVQQNPRRRERRFSGVRPWKERHHLTEKGALPIDLPGHPCDPTRAWADHSLDAGPASYPRGVLRGERPKRVLGPFVRSKGTPSGVRPHQAGKPEPWAVRRTTPYTGEPLGGLPAERPWQGR